MSKIIIMHSGQQATTARWLRDQLSPFGHEVIDSSNLMSHGENWSEAILGAIKASDFVIAIVDDRSENVLFELGYAFGQEKTVILVSVTDVALPSFLQDVIWLRLHKLDDGSAIQVVGAVQVLSEKLKARSRPVETALTAPDFEKWVAEWFTRRGAQVSENQTPMSKGRGFDLLVTDPKTSTRYVVETKRLSANNLVSIDVVRQLTSAVAETGANAGIIIASSDFTPSAQEFARQSHIPLFLWNTTDLPRWDHLPAIGNVYIEARPQGRPEGSTIDDYVVQDHADHVLATFRTQREAIDWAKKNGHTPLVARVRHLNDKKRADHWRAS